MTQIPAVLLLHDGELDDVRELLEEVGADHLHLRGGEIPERVDPPEKLFIATARRAMMAAKWPAGRGASEGLFKIGVVSEDSNTLRSMLRRIGFDLLIRRPVHPEALRLLILHALFRGDERRKEDRVPVGYVVSYRSGLRRRKATLLEFTRRGCRLLSERQIGVGSRLTLDLPREVTDGRALHLRAKVIRSNANGHGAPKEQYAVALSFEKMSAQQRQELDLALKKRESGPPVLPEAMARDAAARPRRPAPAPARAVRLPVAAPAMIEDRRKTRRAAFQGKVTSLDDEAAMVLMGRDLSLGGMRVDPHPVLEVGRTLRLAIYASPDGGPFVVRATVVRSDGEDGVGLRFERLPGDMAAQIESLVAGLPSVESLRGGEADALGRVVSRILESEG
jgi:hypothetical protein